MMTVHVLHAGDGYTYLTRQVASGDHQPLRGQALSDYYLAGGNPPGRWVGTRPPHAASVGSRTRSARIRQSRCTLAIPRRTTWRTPTSRISRHVAQ